MKMRARWVVLIVVAFQLAANSSDAVTTAQAQAAREDVTRWLFEIQNPTGSWGVDARSEPLVTATVLQAFAAFRDPTDPDQWMSAQVRRGEAWLATTSFGATGDMAEALRALDASNFEFSGKGDLLHREIQDRELRAAHSGGQTITPATEGGGGGSSSVEFPVLCNIPFVAEQEHGYGVIADHRGSLLESAAVIEAFGWAAGLELSHLTDDVISMGAGKVAFPMAVRPSYVPQVVPQASCVSATEPNPDVDVLTTARVMLALIEVTPSDPAIAQARAWLESAGVQNSDGGWGPDLSVDTDSDVATTVHVYRALLAAGASPTGAVLNDAMDYMLAQQGVDYWGFSSYRAAGVLLAIAESGLANDADGDGTVDALDPDDDNDGFCDPGQSGGGCTGTDLFPYDPNDHADLDGDGRPDSTDADVDGDGFCDGNCGCSGGIPGIICTLLCHQRNFCSGTDAFPNNPNAHEDSDSDGNPDAHDDDIDGDGVLNVNDAFPEDPNEFADQDRDGLGDRADPDDDNDGIDDAVEIVPILTTLLFSDPECSDGIDNDGDGQIDFVTVCQGFNFEGDCGCESASDVSELDQTGTFQCDDGIDNDGDGFIDEAEDPGCANSYSQTEHTKCQDGINNDGDGLIDFDGGASWNGGVPITAPDPQCVPGGTPKPWKNKERTGCGLGYELALLLTLIGGVRRWRQRRRLMAS